jgi:hypothetical protein
MFKQREMLQVQLFDLISYVKLLASFGLLDIAFLDNNYICTMLRHLVYFLSTHFCFCFSSSTCGL